MTTPYRHLSWPEEVVMMSDLNRSRQHLTEVSSPRSGADYARDFWRRSKRAYRAQWIIDEAQEIIEINALFDLIHGQAGRLWVREPVSEIHHGVKCYPDGDGARTAFVIPFHAYSGTPVVHKDVGNGPRDTTVSYYAAAANLLTDDEAALIESAGSLSGVNLGGGTVTRVVDRGYYGAHCAKVSPSGSQTDYGLLTSEVAAVAGRGYAGMAWMAAGITTAKARLRWYDSGHIELSNSVGAQAAITWAWSPVYVTATAPASTAYARLEVYHDGTAADALYLDCLGISDIAEPWWWLPSMAPGVAVLAAAPDASAIMEAAGTGYRLTRCRLTRDEIGDEIDGLGNRRMSADLIEVWEEWA